MQSVLSALMLFVGCMFATAATFTDDRERKNSLLLWAIFICVVGVSNQ